MDQADGTHKHVVRLDVGVQDSAILQMLQRYEQLLCISPDCRQVQTDVPAKLLQDLPQIHVERLENQAQMVPVLEAGQQPHTVPAVLGVGPRQLAENHQLLLTRLEPGKQDHVQIEPWITHRAQINAL